MFATCGFTTRCPYIIINTVHKKNTEFTLNLCKNKYNLPQIYAKTLNKNQTQVLINVYFIYEPSVIRKRSQVQQSKTKKDKTKKCRDRELWR